MLEIRFVCMHGFFWNFVTCPTVFSIYSMNLYLWPTAVFEITKYMKTLKKHLKIQRSKFSCFMIPLFSENLKICIFAISLYAMSAVLVLRIKHRGNLKSFKTDKHCFWMADPSPLTNLNNAKQMLNNVTAEEIPTLYWDNQMSRRM